MKLDISLEKINEAKAKREAEEQKQLQRVVRTGISMQQTALAAITKSVMPADYAGASSSAAPKGASTQTPQ